MKLDRFDIVVFLLCLPFLVGARSRIYLDCPLFTQVGLE